MKISINLFTLLFLSVTGIAQNYDNKINTVNSRKEHTQAIKLNLLSPFYGTLNLSWQKVLSNEGSFQLTASYTDFDSYGSTENTKENDYNSQTTYSVNGNMTTETSVYNTVKSQRTQGFVLTPEYRYLLNGRNLTGIYVAPFMRYMYYEYSRQLDMDIQTRTYPTGMTYPSQSTYSSRPGSDLYTYHTLGVGVTIGKQIMFKNKVVIDLFAGPSYSILVSSNTEVNTNNDIVIGSGIPNLYIRGYGVRAGITIGLAY